MIVTCERCETGFQLDESRIPESGARVRCSRCKHAFFVTRPGSASAEPEASESREELFDRAADSAITASETPDVTHDLPEEPRAEDLFGELPRERGDEPRAAAPAGGESDESDWQFNADFPTDSEERAPDRRRASEPERTSELGSPSEWNIFDDVAASPEPDAPLAEPRAHVARRVSVPGYDLDQPDAAVDAPSPIVERVVSAVGWLATACLCAVALWKGLAAVPAAETVWAPVAPGVALEGVRGRWLENLHVGRLYVVSGQLRNESPSAFVALPALALELRDGSGRPIDKSFPLTAPRAPDRLREADGAELSAAVALSGQLRGGETRAFEIAVWPLPAEAQRIAIRSGAPSS